MKRLLCLAGLSAIMAAGLSASVITFEFDGTGSGFLGETGFENAAFSLTAVADTANVSEVRTGLFSTVNDSVSITIAGLGTYSFVTPTETFTGPQFNLAGISRVSDGSDLAYSVVDASFGNWDLTTSFAPITGTGQLLQWNRADVVTSGGILFFNTSQPSMTFQASLASTPEPGSVFLLLTGIGGLAVLGVSRRKSSLPLN